MRSLWIACSELPSPPLPSISWTLACLLVVFLFPPNFYAANEDSIAHADHNHPRLLDVSQVLALREGVGNYLSDFIGFDRSIIGRAEEDDQALANNAPGQLNIELGDTQYWTFSNQSLFGPKAAPTSGLPPSSLIQPTYATPDAPDERTLYISLTTCLQPTPKTSAQSGPPGQLELYVSTDSGNKQPSATDRNYAVGIVEGFGSLNISVKSDVYFAISAPANNDFTGVYNYQLTASIDGFYASAINKTNINFIDSDTNSALLYTNHTTTTNNASSAIFQQWKNGPPPFSVYVQNNDNPSIQGVRSSVCALQNLADARSSAAIDTGMTSAGDGIPKQQFHVRNLNASSTYYAITAMVGNSTDSGNGVVGGGGMVWSFGPNFKTKSGMLYSDVIGYPLTHSA